MEKKIIFLELPTDVIEKIDDQNKMSTRSMYLSDIIEKQLQISESVMDIQREMTTHMQTEDYEEKSGEFSLVDSKGISLGTFNINTAEGFKNLAKIIGELSEDPVVQMKVRRWRW